MPRTISAYIKADLDMNDQDKYLRSIVSWGEATTGKKWIFGLDSDTGKLSLSAYGARLIGGSDLEDGQWHHVAIVLPQGATNINQVKMFVDGNELYTNAVSLSLELDTTATEVLIGAHDVSTDPSQRDIRGFFSGSISDVRLFNDAVDNELFTDNGSVESLIGHWKLNESGQPFTIESSGYDLPNKVFGDPLCETGLFGNSFTFNGESDYIIAQNTFGASGAMARTVSAYIKADEDLDNLDNTVHCIASWGESEGGSGHKWFVSLDDTTGQLAVGIYGARLKGGPDLEDGQWHHIAAVLPYGATNINQVLLYVDGEKVTSNANLISAEIDTASTEIIIGAMDRAQTDDQERIIEQFFSGSIDQVQIYNKALTGQEIAEKAETVDNPVAL